MRYFPGAAGSARLLSPAIRSRLRSRRLVLLLGLLLPIGLLVMPQAIAEDEDELEKKQESVQGQIAQVEQDLHRSSKRVHRLDGKLAAAQAELSAARDQLSRVQGKLASAQAKADRIAGQLEQAKQRFRDARADVEQARLDVAAQRETVRADVTELATQGDPRLQAWASLLDADSFEDLMIKRTAGELVVNTQYRSLEDLIVAEAELTQRKNEVKSARDEVAQKKREADQQVRRTQRLVERATAAEAAVDGLVDTTASAKRKAKKARAADRKALEELEAREKRIRRKILAAKSSGPSFTGTADGYLDVPVNGRLTSPYGYRTHPIYGYWGLHDGVDFAASCGSSLYAGSDGKVVHAYYDSVYGYRLYLDIGKVNGDRITLVYNHMPRLAASTGQVFARGDVVGAVGTTGWSTGCHLHFTVLRNGDPVDPMIYL